MKIAAAGLQAPPGYAGAGGSPINMRGAYSGHGVPASAPGQTSMSRHVSLPTGWQSQEAPPGYAGAGGSPINMRGAYSGHGVPGDLGKGGRQHAGACGAGACGAHHGEHRGGSPAGGGTANADPHGRCHCDHVDMLLMDMGAAQNEIRRLQATRAPLIPPEQQPQQPNQQPHQQQQHGSQPNYDQPGQHGASSSPPMELPLALGHLGNISSDRIFDDKVSVHEDFRFNGHKNGYAWK